MIGHEHSQQRPDCPSLQWVTVQGESYEVHEKRCGKDKERRLWNRRPFHVSRRDEFLCEGGGQVLLVRKTEPEQQKRLERDEDGARYATKG